MSLASLFASIASQVSSGTPIWKVSVPASMHSDASGLQAIKQVLFSNAATLRLLSAIASHDSPQDRIACVLAVMLSPHVEWSPNKPFTSVLGEYISEHITLTSQAEQETDEEYRFDIEKIHHHPPKYACRLHGPNFKLYTSRPVESGGELKIRFNSVDVVYPNASVSIETHWGVMEYTLPGIRADPLFTGTRTVGLNGPFSIKDSSGVTFIGAVSKFLKVSGKLLDENGVLIADVKGDLLGGGVKYSDGETWVHPVPNEPFVGLIDTEDVNDPKSSENVWKQVFRHMRSASPDYASADAAKCIIEAADREEVAGHDEKGTCHVSRFGFLDS